MPGPAPTPTKLLKLRGSRRAKQRKGEPEPEIAVYDMPANLTDPVAQEEWQRVTAEMMAIGTAARIDHAAVEAYAVCYARWRMAEAELAKQGPVVKSPNGYPILSPWLSVANSAIAQLRSFAQELGLSPSARTRIKVADKPDPYDEFDEFIQDTNLHSEAGPARSQRKRDPLLQMLSDRRQREAGA